MLFFSPSPKNRGHQYIKKQHIWLEKLKHLQEFQRTCVESFRVSSPSTAWPLTTKYKIGVMCLNQRETCTVMQLPDRVVRAYIITHDPCSTVPVLGFPVMISAGTIKHTAQNTDDPLGPVFRGSRFINYNFVYVSVQGRASVGGGGGRFSGPKTVWLAIMFS